MAKLTLVLVLPILILNTVSALRCYQCNHPVDESCDVTTDCSFMCDPDYEIVFQGCYLSQQCEIIEKVYANNPVVSVKECRMCETDFCNNSGSKNQNLIVLVICILGFYYVM
ncbi:uncharacterized protein LOC123004367 isoform X2 [Tribolium madens]|uniref:uncharacterized protein LOC123004367 isoform X2 n=1 Tax=Tribolium madens TaxID=41895 RepID=UPI001CF74279|nr:uncharacterized protein LOC123004367 isoform X2 [Tribolium madens]